VLILFAMHVLFRAKSLPPVLFTIAAMAVGKEILAACRPFVSM
jgi:hypothetical protein